MKEPDFGQARAYALLRLERELPPTMCYHSLEHTRDDVAPASERLARVAGIEGQDLMLLRTAAYFHDLGLIEQRENHETVSARLAELVLPGFGYAAEQIAAIKAMIMATRLPQQPSTFLASILADSDLDVLGRQDFVERNCLLRAELAAFEPPLSDAAWYRQQITFVQTHRYWTPMARALRGNSKAHNLVALRELLMVAEGVATRQP